MLLTCRDGDGLLPDESLYEPRLPERLQITVTQLAAVTMAEAVNATRRRKREGMERVRGDSDEALHGYRYARRQSELRR